MAKPLAVFDCVVLVQSLFKQAGPAVECIDRFRAGSFDVAVSKATLVELREVLSRSSLRNDFPLLTNERVAALLALLRWKGKLVRRGPQHFTYPRDPHDEPYVKVAIEAQAHFLVTRDNDLLDLMKWETEESREFQKRFRSLRIVNPIAFLQTLEQQQN